MENKNSILFVTHAQFGYHIDYVQYVKYLKENYQITFLCRDYGRPKMDEPGINIVYILRNGNIIARNWRFISSAIRQIRTSAYSVVFVHYFRGCSLINVFGFSKAKFHLDIRSGSIALHDLKRSLLNAIITFESSFYKSVSVISEGLRNLLRLKRSTLILPLGANPIDIDRDLTSGIRLLYVGTLTRRNLEDTIAGVHIYRKTNPNAKVHYTIIGSGWYNEEIDLKQRIKNYDLESTISMVGYVPHSELKRYYENSNVGVSYIPITPYYQFQPATKTFEYLMAGMPVIATETIENSKIINSKNGVIIKDNAEGFAKGIASINDNIKNFKVNEIIGTVEIYRWDKIIGVLNEYLSELIGR